MIGFQTPSCGVYRRGSLDRGLVLDLEKMDKKSVFSPVLDGKTRKTPAVAGDFLWFSHGFPWFSMVFPWFPMIFPRFFRWRPSPKQSLCFEARSPWRSRPSIRTRCAGGDGDPQKLNTMEAMVKKTTMKHRFFTKLYKSTEGYHFFGLKLVIYLLLMWS